MTFFGTTLLEKGFITEEKLVDALVTQSNELPSPLRICFEESLLSADQILDAIASREKGEHFPAVCTRLGLWTSQTSDTVKAVQKKARHPLGQILVDQFGIDLSTISGELSHSDAPPPTSPSTDKSQYNFAFPSVSGETKKQYLDFFSQSVKDSLEGGFNDFEKPDLNANVISSIEEIVQQLAAAASFARMEISFTVCEKLGALISAITINGIDSVGSKSSIKTACLKTLDVLWELHRFIEISGSEEEFWANDISRGNFSSALTLLDSFANIGEA